MLNSLQLLIKYQKNIEFGFLDARNFFLKRSFCTEVCRCEQTSCARSVPHTKVCGSQTRRHKIIFLSLFYLISIFLSVSYVSAFEFGVSPSELNFNGKIEEKICNKVYIFSSFNEINMAIEDRWSTKNNTNKDINNYLTNSSVLRITIDYERNFILNKEKEINICLKSKDSGKFKGVLFFQALDGSLNIGVWLNANISNINKVNKLTGLSISNFNSYIDNSTKVFL
ncbi:MAG: hypothetical protein AABX96_01900, partial [Nanoarchaeota archaeon]